MTADSYYRVWNDFNTEMHKIFVKANGGEVIPGIIASSKLTANSTLLQFVDKDKYIIQIRTKGSNEMIKNLLEAGYRVIFSKHEAWYLDCGFGAYVGEGNNWCSPYNEWQKVYDYNPMKVVDNLTFDSYVNKSLIIGGEVALWSEQVDDHNIDSKVS